MTAPQPAEPVIVADRLSRRFGKLTAVREVSMVVKRGEIFGVLGPNGAGKSTTIRMLCGILDPSGGRGSVVGYDIATQSESIKRNIGYMTQRFSLYEDMTVEENLRFYASIYGVPARERRERMERVLQGSGLGERRDQLAGTLSGGWKQRVALASATIHDPPLLFLDEPTAGVDPVSRRDFWDQIHRISAAGTTVLVTTHYMDEAERCHRLAFIFRGALLATGSPSEIVAQRHLHVVEIEAERSVEAAELLRKVPGVEEVSHFGQLMRVALRDSGAEGSALARVRDTLTHAEIPWQRCELTRATVEDAFVSMVREDEALRARPSNQAAPANQAGAQP